MFLLQTDRLDLREFTDGDLEELAPILGDPEVMRFSLRGPADRAAVARAIAHYLDSYRRNGFGRWAVVERSSQELLGFCGVGLMPVDGVDTPELGYRLRRESWGHGYATEAAVACRDYAFASLGIERLIAMIEPANVGSVGVARKVGFDLDRETVYESVPVEIYVCDRVQSKAD